MRNLLLIITVLISSISAAAPATSADVDRLEKRIDDLEKIQQETFSQMHESNSVVKPFLKHSILLGGFFETAITHINGPNTKSQYSANANVLGLNVSAEMDSRNRVVSQILTSSGYPLSNPHNDPRTTGANPRKRQYTTYTRSVQVNQAYYEHTVNQAFNIQMGTGYVPYGFAFQQRELVLFKRREGPQMVAASNFTTSVGIAFPLWTGLHLHGSFLQAENRIGYNLYTLTPTTNAKNIGGGARLWFRWREWGTFGLSSQIGDELSNTYLSNGADADFKFGRYGITVEYAKTSVTKAAVGLETYYAQPYVEFYNGKFILYGVADYMDNPTWLSQTTPVVIRDTYQRWDLGGGINWLPRPTIRFRLGYLNHNYVGDNARINGQDRDYYRVDASTGISF